MEKKEISEFLGVLRRIIVERKTFTGTLDGLERLAAFVEKAEQELASIAAQKKELENLIPNLTAQADSRKASVARITGLLAKLKPELAEQEQEKQVRLAELDSVIEQRESRLEQLGERLEDFKLKLNL